MALRFFFDECTDSDVAKALVRLGMDIVTVSQLQRKGLSDQEHLDFAFLEQRVVYSTDRDFLRLANSFLKRGLPFAGLVYHRPHARSKRFLIDTLVLMDGVYEPADMMNHIEYI